MLNDYEDTEEIRALKRRYGLNEAIGWEQDLRVKNVLESFRANAIKPTEVTDVMHEVLGLKLPIKECKKHAERFEV